MISKAASAMQQLPHGMPTFNLPETRSSAHAEARWEASAGKCGAGRQASNLGTDSKGQYKVLMRIVGVSRILNEDELIEAFVRHHAPMLDLHIILDNGSTDRTLPILRALQAEGIALQVFQTTSPILLEHIYNTGLFRLAKAAGADWVCFLDADELLCLRHVRPGLSAHLGAVPPEVLCLNIPVFRYLGVSNPGEPNPFRRLTRREREPHMHKIFIRGTAQHQINIFYGNHGAFIDGVATEGVAQDDLRLLHFPERSPMQAAKKIILARVKALATGAEVAATCSIHHAASFQMLTQDAGHWMAEFAAQDAAALTSEALIDDPIEWHGGALTHTTQPDELAGLLRQFASYAETLALSHGALLDKGDQLRTEMLQQGALARHLF